MLSNSAGYTNPFEKDELLEKSFDGVHLIVHNDEVNTFDWVIESLMDICGHTLEQAEQCALLIHHKGRYAVKSGAFDQLNPMREALTERGINATIEGK